MVLKELIDNGLDAAEAAGITPRIAVSAEVGTFANSDTRFVRLTVVDNGPGMAPEVIEKILDFTRSVSDKAAYRSPTLGASRATPGRRSWGSPRWASGAG